MLVWALRALGADPAFFVGGEVPGLGEEGEAANAGWGEGEWVVAEADESDASFLRLKPEIAVVTNVEMDHHARWGSMAELRAGFDEFAGAGAAASPSFDEALDAGPGRAARSRSPAGTTCSTPAPPWRRSGSPAFDSSAAAGALAGFPGVRRRLELKGERGGARDI